MMFRISPLWWPALALVSPFVTLFLIIRNKQYRKNRKLVRQVNDKRIEQATALDLPELDYLELTVLVEEKKEDGFIGDAGVSYLFRTNLGSLLFDMGFGSKRPALSHNVEKLGLHLDDVDAFAISHLHPDHMGGMGASLKKQVALPATSENGQGKRPCFLPDKASSETFLCELVKTPRLLSSGIGTTGPLARSLFFLGYTEEQALVAKVKGKGLVVFTGCGHPTVKVIMKMVSRISKEPIYAFGGGLHFPITAGRGNRAGIQIQRLIGTGKPPWELITEEDMNGSIDILNQIRPEKVYLSGHDSCDHALQLMQERLHAETKVLKAGATYHF
jgi:7,8-dihydropterin-6-yl-methyl-4-(beta-D-ribofuranosyl)aminobenzene 5'-phosphate synthase